MRTANGATIQPDAWQNFSKIAAAVTPSDTVALVDITRYIYVGGVGDLTVVMADDPAQVAVTFKAVPVGTLLPIAVSMVKSTLTTATNIVAMY
ncbi:MAG: hypothetical protein JWO52_4048 [Gammaproteobacteria bacterium]|jgi:hypothetical protein|nr:hypothetical protein [Gammaproteobacteria bacterium]